MVGPDKQDIDLPNRAVGQRKSREGERIGEQRRVLDGEGAPLVVYCRGRRGMPCEV